MLERALMATISFCRTMLAGVVRGYALDVR